MQHGCKIYPGDTMYPRRTSHISRILIKLRYALGGKGALGSIFLHKAS